MQVLWSGHDRAQWDAWHRTAAAALQQDWAYGEAMQSGGVRCLRARVLREGRTLAIAQFIGVRVALLVSTGLCSRGLSGSEAQRAAAPAARPVLHAR